MTSVSEPENSSDVNPQIWLAKPKIVIMSYPTKTMIFLILSGRWPDNDDVVKKLVLFSLCQA